MVRSHNIILPNDGLNTDLYIYVILYIQGNHEYTERFMWHL